MANLNKKFSELNEKAKKTLKEQFGSKKAAVQAHSANRVAAGKKPPESPRYTSDFFDNLVSGSQKISDFVGPLQTDKDGTKILPPGFIDDLGINSGKSDGGKKPDIDRPSNVIEDTKPKNLGTKVYERLMPKLLDKAETYEQAFSSKDYLKDLKDKATERMKIGSKSYGRKSDDTPFKKMSLAQKYDTNRKKLLSNLSKPLTNYLDKSVKDNKRGLNMFTKTDGEYKPVFNSKRLKEFSSAGNLGNQTLQRASSLGATKKDKKRLEGIGNVKNTTSDSFKNKFAQDLQFM